MRRLYRWMVLGCFALASQLAGAETWSQAARRLEAQGQGFRQSLSASWGGDLAREDLALLLGTLATFEQWNSDPDRPLSQELLQEVRRSLGRHLRGLRVSLATQGEGSADPWLEELSQMEKHLQQVETSFDGRFLPSRHQLLASDWSKNWQLPGYQSPEELLREARSIRLDLQSGQNPWVAPGAGLPGFGPFGLGYAGNGWGQEYQELLQAADRFERVCQQPYEDVRQTEVAFRRLDRAFQRVWPATRSTSFDLRNIERSLLRLERFYQALRTP